MTNFNDFLNEQMKDPEFKAEWDALDPEFSVIEAMLKARKESGLTQKQLSERTGIAQTDISKLERGNANPSLRTLQRLAAGMGIWFSLSANKNHPKTCVSGWFFCACNIILYCHARSGRISDHRACSCRKASKQQSRYILLTAAKMVLRSSRRSSLSTVSGWAALLPNTTERLASSSSQKIS